MRVVDVKPREITVFLELTIGEVEKVLDFLDGCGVEFNVEGNEKLKEAFDFIKSDFYRELLDVLNMVRQA